MVTSKEVSKKDKPRSLWKNNVGGYQYCITTPSNDTTTKREETEGKIIYVEELEKRKKAYGLCGECNEPGVGWKWCQPCNAKRFKENFKNWTSGNKDIDEFMQQSQLHAVHWKNCIEWIPFEKFQNVTYIASGSFGKIYSADWHEGHIEYWDIKKQEWGKNSSQKVALKSLGNSSEISADFLNEIKSHLRIYHWYVIRCYGMTQDPDTKEYMMVLLYCKNGNLRDYLNNSISYQNKIYDLSLIARGLLSIHSSGKVHKNFHSGNILFNVIPYVSDLGMCQPANNKEQQDQKEGAYGVLPYMAPEVLRGHQYTKASDIYSFGIVMNEFMSEETPYINIPHDRILAVRICQGLRPRISEDTPKLLADLIMRCWDAEAENRPTTKELYQILDKLHSETFERSSEIYSQIKECEKIREENLLDSLSERKCKNIETHPQAVYTSRLLNFKNLPEPVNSLDLQLNSDAISVTSSASSDLISECLDVQLSEFDFDEINQDEEDNIE